MEPPVPTTRLNQIITDACERALKDAECYDHAKTDEWNTTIIHGILKALVAETSVDSVHRFKFACNSTIVQHLLPSSMLNKPLGQRKTTTAADGATATESSEPAAERTEDGVVVSGGGGGQDESEATQVVGRRGIHSATGAFWDQSTDGMYSFKYRGAEDRGMDVVLMVIWVGL